MKNKTFQTVQNGKAKWYVVRQDFAAGDKMYKLGDRIPGLGRVIGIRETQ